MTKKKLQQVVALSYQKYGQEITATIADDLKDIGFLYATKSGLSMGMNDFSDIPTLDIMIEAGEKKAKEISDQYDQGFITEEET